MPCEIYARYALSDQWKLLEVISDEKQAIEWAENPTSELMDDTILHVSSEKSEFYGLYHGGRGKMAPSIASLRVREKKSPYLAMFGFDYDSAWNDCPSFSSMIAFAVAAKTDEKLISLALCDAMRASLPRVPRSAEVAETCILAIEQWTREELTRNHLGERWDDVYSLSYDFYANSIELGSPENPEYIAYKICFAVFSLCCGLAKNIENFRHAANDLEETGVDCRIFARQRIGLVDLLRGVCIHEG